MKTRCSMLEEAMAPCDALVCASMRMRCGARILYGAVW